MSSEGLLKNGRKKVVIVGGGAAGMVGSLEYFQRPSSIELTPPLVLRCHPRTTP